MAEKAKTVRGAAAREQGLDPEIEALLIATTDVQRVTNRILKAISRKRRLTQRGLHIINLIRVGLNRPSRLIEYFDVLPSTITSDTEKLVAAGFIERQAVPADRRVTQLALTRKGSALRQEALAQLNSGLRERIAQIPPENLRICIETLRLVTQPLDVATPPSDSAEKGQDD